jgi:hypothetical protein
LVQALDNILKRVLIYETVRFDGVALSPETLALKSQDPKGTDLIRLNRLLLEDAYPREIAKSQKLIEADIQQNTKEQIETREKALKAVKYALVLDPTWTDPLIEVLIRSDKPDRDDYLTEFENDNEFRKELGLSTV